MSQSLLDFQKAFLNSVLKGESSEAFLENIVPAGKLKNAEAVLQVHARGYIVALTEQLGETFEAVWWTLGDEDFFKACEAFIKENTWQSYNLLHYGEGFADFLAQDESLNEIPFLKDLADFEWIFRTVFHLDDAESASDEELLIFQTGQKLKVELNPTLYFKSSPYAVYSLWEMRQGVADENDQDLDVHQAEHCLIYKKDKQVFIYPVGLEAFDLIEALSRTELSFQDFLEDYAKTKPIGPDLVQHTFQLLVQERLIYQVHAI